MTTLENVEMCTVKKSSEIPDSHEFNSDKLLMVHANYGGID